MRQVQRKAPFIALATLSGAPWWAPYRASGVRLFPWGLRLCPPGDGRSARQPRWAALQPHRLGLCSARGNHWLDPGLPEASMSSLLVNMRNAPIRAPDGTQTNLGCRLRPAHFQGLGLTSVLFPLVAIEP